MLTWEVADVVMCWCEGEFLSLAETATAHRLDNFILVCALYINDDWLAFEFLPPGAR